MNQETEGLEQWYGVCFAYDNFSSIPSTTYGLQASKAWSLSTDQEYALSTTEWESMFPPSKTKGKNGILIYYLETHLFVLKSNKQQKKRKIENLFQILIWLP